MAEPGVRQATADVAVIGAGPAGIAAAALAAESGARVLLLDEAPRPGGQIWRHRSRETLPRQARAWLARLDASGARVLCGTSVVDAQGTRLLAQDAGGALAVTARAVVLATGARELFLPFPGWTLPGVMGAGGTQALLKSGMPVAGKRVLVAGSGPLLLAVAAALRAAGAIVPLVAEQATAAALRRFALGLWRAPGKALAALRYRAALPGTGYLRGTWVVSAQGEDVVRGATLTDGRRRWTEACDLLAVGFGLVPAVELARLLGCQVDAGGVRVDELQRTSVADVFCAGEPVGIAGLDAALVEGQIAGLAAAGRTGAALRLSPARERQRSFARRLEAAFALREELRSLADGNTVVCRCEDVTLARIDPAWGTRAAKLYTRAGMGACQGRVCGSALRFLYGWTPDTTRAPVVPATVHTLMQWDTNPMAGEDHDNA